MSEFYLELKNKLLLWKLQLLQEEQKIQHQNGDEIIDCINKDEEYMLSVLEKNKKLRMLNLINLALSKMENNTYGICEISGETIDFRRLKANPLARYCVEIQEVMEKG